MQKNSTQKALFFSTLFFVLLALFSFAAFRETGQVYACAESCLKNAASSRSGEMLWELVFNQFLSTVFM